MKFSETGFRALYHQYTCFPIEPFRSITMAFPGNDKADHILTYGFVDHEEGLILEVLACGVEQDGKYNFYKTNPQIRGLAKITEVTEVDFDLLVAGNTSIPEIFKEKTDPVNARDEDTDLPQLRDIEEYDPFRDPAYVDDLTVHLIQEGRTLEICKVRMEELGVRCVIGTLLEEPYQNFGFHKGDRIPVTIDDSDPPRCIANLNPDQFYTKEQFADGTLLKAAITDFNQDPCEDHLHALLEAIRDSDLWIACKPGSDASQIEPDLFQNDGDSFLPVFSHPDEMGEYASGFTATKEDIIHLIDLVVDRPDYISAIVLNPFSQSFILERRFFDTVYRMRSRIIEQ